MTVGGLKLDFDETRTPSPPRDAATLVLLRPAPGASGFEVACVERSPGSRFLGGAVVFPGGKVDEADADPAWAKGATLPRGPFEARFAVAACREALEELAVLPLVGGTVTAEELLALRTALAAETTTLLRWLTERAWGLDLAALVPFARWVTPVAEARRYDARFFLARAPAGHDGLHDGGETTASFWATPLHVLARWSAGEIQLAPPTHRTLAWLSGFATLEDALKAAGDACLDPVCPRLVRHVDGSGETRALVLPGDRDHEVRERRVPGPSRFVLRGERFVPEDAP